MLGDRGPADWGRRRANHPGRWATLRESTYWMAMVPAVLKVCWKLAPGAILPLSKDATCPESLVTVWATESMLTKLMVPPIATLAQVGE